MTTLSKGAAKKVTIYVNEDARYHSGPLYESILLFLLHKGVAGATATRAMAGFGAHQVMHTPKIEALAEHLPIRIEFVEKAERIDELLPTLYDMVTDGLIDVQDTTVVKVAMKEGRAGPQQPHERKQGKAKLMRIYLGEADKWHGEPLYEAIVEKCRQLRIAGATVFRGLEGFGETAEIHRAHLLAHDQPIVITIVDSADNLQGLIPAIEDIMDTGMIAMSDVTVTRIQ